MNTYNKYGRVCYICGNNVTVITPKHNCKQIMTAKEESGDDDVGSLRVDRGVFDLESLWHEEKENSEAAVVDDEDWN
eukprot:scaffold37663_cov132-Skeletonema_marinoi.AAC.10